jgi:hypothetical protein
LAPLARARGLSHLAVIERPALDRQKAALGREIQVADLDRAAARVLR